MDFTITCQCNLRLIVVLSISYGLIKFFKRLTASLKQSNTSSAKLRCDRTISVNSQISRSICGDVFLCCYVIPSLELVAAGWSSDYLVRSQGTLRIRGFLCDRCPVYGIGTIFCRKKSCRGIHIGDQCDVCKRNRCSRIGTT